MQSKTLMLLIGMLLVVFLSYEAFAEDQLVVEADTANAFTGNYVTGKDIIVFKSAMDVQDEVRFSININGTERVTWFTLTGDEASRQQYAALTEAEQDIMFDAMNAMTSYYQKSHHHIEMPALVMVSGLGYLSHR